MPYWTHDRLFVELAQLIEDVHQVGEDALALDNRAGGSVGLPPPMIGTWAGFGEFFWADRPRQPTMWDDLRALQRRGPDWDDSELAWGRSSSEIIWWQAHGGLRAVEDWSGEGSPTEGAALTLRRSLVNAEDQGLRCTSGFGDVRRSVRRQNA